MKQVKRLGFVTALLCITATLITAFMVLFSYSESSATESKVKGTVQNKTLISSEPVLIKN